MSKSKAVAKKNKNNDKSKPSKKHAFWLGTKYFFKTWLSNFACVEGRKFHWWWAFIVGLFSVLIATIPTMVYYFTLDGGSFLDGTDYGFSEGLVAYEKTINASDNFEMKIEDGKLVVSSPEAIYTTHTMKDGTEVSFDYYVAIYEHDEVEYVVDSSSSESSEEASESVTSGIATYVTVYDAYLAIYFCGEENPYTYAYTSIMNGSDPTAKFGYEDATTYSTNFIVFGNESFYAAKNPSGTDTPSSAVMGKYSDVELDGFDFKKITTHEASANTLEYAEETRVSWRNFLTLSYRNTKNSAAWQYTGICVAINVAVLLLSGLMVFLMTRGKNNPNRGFSYLDATKISLFASFSPAVLSLIGLMSFIAKYAMFVFMFLMMMRMMWMSMRALRPEYTQQ